MTHLEAALKIKKNNYNCDVLCHECPLEDINRHESCGSERDKTIKDKELDEDYQVRVKLIDDFIKDGINPIQKIYLKTVKTILESGNCSCDDVSCDECPFYSDSYDGCGGERDTDIDDVDEDEEYQTRKEYVRDYLEKVRNIVTTPQPTSEPSTNEGVVFRSELIFQSPKKYYRLIKW